MAESRVDVALDVSNRPYLVYDVELSNTRIGAFDASLTEDFAQALAQNAGLDLHVTLTYGRSPHMARSYVAPAWAGTVMVSRYSTWGLPSRMGRRNSRSSRTAITSR